MTMEQIVKKYEALSFLYLHKLHTVSFQNVHTYLNIYIS